MKTMKRTLFAAIIGLLLFGNPAMAQDKKVTKSKTPETPAKPAEPKQRLLTVTTMHRNMDDKSLTMDGWKAIEKEYFNKVIMKNDLILGYEILTHYFTADNTELLLVKVYDSWEAIEKASNKEDELIKAAWPDEKARTAFFDKRQRYYAPNHSDEIYASFPGAKVPSANFTKPMLFYIRKSHWANPKDGTEKEFNELRNKYLSEVTRKNDFIKAYYPNVHAWGADNTEFTEVIVVETLADIEKAFDKDDELFKATWADEAKAKAFDDNYNKYFTGVHGDYIYRSIPELSK